MKWVIFKLGLLPHFRRTAGVIFFVPDTVDLAKTSYDSRINLALDLYEILLEKLYIAAKDGKNHLIIKEKAIVSNIEKVGDILSYQLFKKHNVYRILTTRGECTIYLTRNAFNWRRNHENRSWVDPTDPTNHQSFEAPPPPPPVETHSPLIHRRNFRRNQVGLSPLNSPRNTTTNWTK